MICTMSTFENSSGHLYIYNGKKIFYMNQQFFELTRLLFILLDLLMLNAAFIIAKDFFANKTIPTLEVQYLYLLMFMNIAWITPGGYAASINRYISSFELFAGRRLRAYIYFLALVMIGSFSFKQHDISRLFIITVFFFRSGASS